MGNTKSKTLKFKHITEWDQEQYLKSIDWKSFSEEVTEHDQKIYERITSTDLTKPQIEIVKKPARIYRKQRSVLAVHWHPEQVPMDLVMERVNNTFPNRENELIIPTQHNQILTNKGYAGVEVDCYSEQFRRKVQILLHFKEEKLDGADRFRKMINHTFRYRSTQLFEFIETLLDPKYEDRLEKAALNTTASGHMLRFIRTYTQKLKTLIYNNELNTPPMMIKNKLLRNFFDSLRSEYDPRLIDRIQIFLKSVKKVVKANFNYGYFYQTHEMIEEARSNGAGIIVPHPEQFWPILLADYDIDGYEVWNPQSRDYTDFLISVVNRLNQSKRYHSRPILITMGDDCHMGEKLKPVNEQDTEKAGREIGVQSAWDDLEVRKNLIMSNIDRKTVIDEYKSRLS